MGQDHPCDACGMQLDLVSGRSLPQVAVLTTLGPVILGARISGWSYYELIVPKSRST